MANLVQTDPSLAATPAVAPPPASSEPVRLPDAVSAPANVEKPKRNFFGGPKLESNGELPSMRTSEEDALPIPSDEPIATN